MNPKEIGPIFATRMSRRGFITGAAGGIALVALPAWPDSAQASGMVTTTGAPILQSHPATEPSGTHVRRIGETNVVFAYGTVVPSFDGWRSKEPERNYLDLDGEWKFAFDPDTNGLRDDWQASGFDDRAWGTIAVPSAWDLRDTPNFGTVNGADFGQGTAFSDGYAWFRRDIHLTGQWHDRHLRVNFLAAGYSADVWLDGEYLGKHEGASTPFSMPVSTLRGSGNKHTLAVRVFRRASYTAYTGGGQPVIDDLEIPYKPVDYWPYAGITHSAWLEGVASTSISKILIASVDGQLAARVILENYGSEGFSGSVTFDPGPGSGAALIVKQVTVPSNAASVVVFDIAVPNASRWSPRDPAMHTAHVSLHANVRSGKQEPIDGLTVKYGLRTLDVANEAIEIDGEAVFLKGLSWHEESAANGRSMKLWEYDLELTHVLDLNANFIRNCVYNRHPYVYDWADTNGVMVMDDIDTMWLNTQQQRIQTEEYGLSRAMALNMAWNQQNHPSVILWGLQNESEIDAGGAPVYRAWLSQLKAAVKDVDLAQRPVTWASATTNDPAFDLADVIGFNEYFGYFYGSTADLGPAIDAVHTSHPGKPILITENGTWALFGNHGPSSAQGTEEWQAEYLAAHWQQVVVRKPFMAGYTAWVLRDYKERAGYNQTYNGVSVLGLLTFDAEEKKVAYARFKGLV